MSLESLCQLVDAVLINGSAAAVLVSGVQDDSRRVRPGDLFVAVPGLSVDGHDYAARAVELGAIAVVVERRLDDLNTPQLVVKDAGYALGLLAAHAAGRPCERLRNIGITGTNGKTTTT